jgi:(p)ppGpp synthase/HD superfamily hydrolase
MARQCYQFAVIREARKLAAYSHSGIFRKEKLKGKRLPYDIHLAGTADLLLGFDACQSVVVAGLLHDCPEDTPTTLAEIEAQFGSKVASLVMRMTEPKGESWDVRKKSKIVALRTGDFDLKLLGSADHCDNLMSLLEAFHEEGLQTAEEFKNAKVWSEFNQPYERQKWYHQESCKAIFANVPLENLSPLFGKLMRLVETIFGEKIIEDPAVRRKVRRRKGGWNSLNLPSEGKVTRQPR